MSSLTKRFKTSAQHEDNGAWLYFTDAANDDGTVPALLIARTTSRNQAYQKELSAALEPLQKAMRLKSAKQEDIDAAFMRAFVRGAVKDWQHMLDDEGKSMPFSIDACMAQFEELPEVYAIATGFANNMENYREATLQEDAKN